MQTDYLHRSCRTYFQLNHNKNFRTNGRLNWKDVQRRNVVYNVDMSSLRAPWQNGPYKKPTHRTTQKHVEHQDAADI